METMSAALIDQVDKKYKASTPDATTRMMSFLANQRQLIQFITGYGMTYLEPIIAQHVPDLEEAKTLGLFAISRVCGFATFLLDCLESSTGTQFLSLPIPMEALHEILQQRRRLSEIGANEVQKSIDQFITNQPHLLEHIRNFVTMAVSPSEDLVDLPEQSKEDIVYNVAVLLCSISQIVITYADRSTAKATAWVN